MATGDTASADGPRRARNERGHGPGRGHEPGRVPGEITISDLTRGGGTVLTDRKGRLVVQHGDLIVKTHMAGEAVEDLLARLRLAADPGLREVLLAPLPIRDGFGGLLASIAGRLVSAWPAGVALGQREVEESLASAPWAQAAALLAHLHRTDLTAFGPGRVPAAAVRARLRRSMDRLATATTPPAPGTPPRAPDTGADADTGTGAGFREAARLADDVRRAYTTLPAWLERTPTRPGGQRALIHGDWHLGQVVRVPGPAAGPAGSWRIVDIDDLGYGDPAWDLARPAAWFAAGLLPPDVWAFFLASYRQAGGVAVPATGDPWPVLDGPARAVTLQYAAGAVADLAEGTPLDDGARAFVDCARRMAGTAR